MLVLSGCIQQHRLCAYVVQLEVFPDEEVRVVNANQVPDDDYASVFDGVTGAQLSHLTVHRHVRLWLLMCGMLCVIAIDVSSNAQHHCVVCYMQASARRARWRLASRTQPYMAQAQASPPRPLLTMSTTQL